MTAYDDLLAAAAAIEQLPQEPWMHARRIDGRWDVLEQGLAPRGWRE